MFAALLGRRKLIPLVGNERKTEMKKLIMVGAVAFAACAGAEEKSFWSSLFSSAEDTDAVAETAAKATGRFAS